MRKLNWKSVAAALALACVSMPSYAALVCTTTTDWGANLGPPGFMVFGGVFASPGTYNNCYTFSLGGGADSVGGVIEIDGNFNQIDLDVTAVSLFLNSLQLGIDTSPQLFLFSGLDGGGGYTLNVESLVTAAAGRFPTPVAFIGGIGTVARVAEPTTLTLLGVGLLGLAIVRRRRALTR